MLNQILKTAEKYSMINPGDEVTAALSGGADSVCLLLALCELKDVLQIKLSALHVNHCLRGEESDRDEEFCRSLCMKLGIPFVCGRFDVRAEAEKLKLSTELAAREIRYRFFAEHTQGRKLATAHNANDNAETVIFNLTRGTGTKGIAGIPPVRDNIIRPLISVTRAQIEEYLASRNQNYVTDSSNLTDDYTRNTIRHNVIPVLEGINSNLFMTIASDSDNFRTDNSFIEEETEKAYTACRTAAGVLSGLAEYHTAVRRRCISRLLSENHIEINSRRISDMENILVKGGKINLAGDIYAVSEKGRISITAVHKAEKSTESGLVPLEYGEVIFRNRKFRTELLSFDGTITENMIDADRIRGTAFIRGRMPGDRIKLAGKDFTSSVKKLFNARVDADKRDSILFVSDDEGPVFIEGFGAADRVRVTDITKNVLVIKAVCE